MMNFSGALNQIKKGEKAYRVNWAKEKVFIYLDKRFGGSDVNPTIVIRTANGTLSAWLPSSDDLLSEDWSIKGNEQQLDLFGDQK